jgi:branched-subunit amino acid transport protein
LFVHKNQLDTALDNPYLWGALAAIAAAYKTANIYWTVGLGMLAFAAVNSLSF